MLQMLRITSHIASRNSNKFTNKSPTSHFSSRFINQPTHIRLESELINLKLILQRITILQEKYESISKNIIVTLRLKREKSLKR